MIHFFQKMWEFCGTQMYQRPSTHKIKNRNSEKMYHACCETLFSKKGGNFFRDPQCPRRLERTAPHGLFERFFVVEHFFPQKGGNFFRCPRGLGRTAPHQKMYHGCRGTLLRNKTHLFIIEYGI